MPLGRAERSSGERTTKRGGVFVGALILALVFLVLLRWSWLKWPDVMIDFGEVLYVPWQLAEGQRLYADVGYYYGPLAPYAIALWFRLFGVSVMTLVATNLAVLVAITALLYRLLLAMAGPLGATVGGVTFLTLFAFPQLLATGNYNYVTPYEANVTYGVLLSLIALELVARFAERPRSLLAFGIGLAVGLVFLTKPETFLAVAAAAVVGIGSMVWLDPRMERRAACVAIFATTLVAVPVSSALLLALSMPLPQAIAGTLGSWTGILGSQVSSLAFFRESMGTDDVAGNLRSLLAWTAGYAVLFVPALCLGLLNRAPAASSRRRVSTWVVAVIAFLLATVVASLLTAGASLAGIARPLPVLTMLAAAVAAAQLVRKRSDREARARSVLMLASLSFALVLLLKMILNARIEHYGFALAMPATVLLAVGLTDWVPAWIRAKGGRGEIFTATASAALALVIAGRLTDSAQAFAAKETSVGENRDRFLADERGPFVNAALAEIERRVGPEETLLVVPEGVMLNYLTRRRSPTPYVNLNPTGMAVFGEGEILEALRRAPPDYIAVVDKETSDFGLRFFGRDYAREIQAWIAADYRKIYLVGEPPLRGRGFGILLLQRKAMGS